jgi:hypothetical protein
MLYRLISPTILFLALFPAPVSAVEDAGLQPPPWHLIDIWWNIGQDAPFESYSIDATISDDVPPTVNLYVAPIGIAELSGTKFYGGIQTQADGYTKRDQHLRQIGPGFLMSMWGERSPEAIRPSAGGLWQSSGHEGDFVSVRRPYEWKKGKYTYRVVRMDRELVEGKPSTWVGAFVYVRETDENIFVGALRFPGESLVLSSRLASFVEIYGRLIPVEEIPKVTVTLGNLRVNGQVLPHPSATAVYPKGVPDHADAVARDGQLVVRVGEPIADRKQRQVKLLPER